jgi:soluble lytic murein transglycosylase-like protein
MRVPLPVKKPISKPLFTPSPNVEVYEPMIITASQRYSVDPNLVRAVIKAESNFNHRAVSPKGAMGLMQLMPETAQKMAVANPFNPEENIHGGVRYLSELLQLLDRNLPLALAAYNAGPERVIGRNEIPSIEETRNYVQRVIMYYKNLNRDYK